MIKREAVEITLHIHKITDEGFLVSDTGKIEDATWVAGSLVEVEDPIEGKDCEFVLPEWLAIREGFV